MNNNILRGLLWASLCLASLLRIQAVTVEQSTIDELDVHHRKTYKVTGIIKDAHTGEPLPYATISITGTSLGATSGDDGKFTVDQVTRKEVIARISYVGYGTVDVPLTVDVEHTISLEPWAINMQEVVISANRTETRRNLAPVLVNVTNNKLFAATNSVAVDEALKFNPGIRVEDNCQNCGFNQVRINGLDGSYSQIVINSRSIFSSLAGVYGLEMLPTAMIDRIEVVRGGGSALYGSSAIGGTINIITKAPERNTAEASYTITGVDGNYNRPMHDAGLFASVIDDSRNAGISVFGKVRSRPAMAFVHPQSTLKQNLDPEKGILVPRDGDDGFSEIPYLYNSTIGTSAFYALSPAAKFSLDYFYMQEDRRGGDMIGLFSQAAYKPEHEAAVAESLRHRIHTGILRYDQKVADGKGFLTAFIAGAHTNRISYYGGGPIDLEASREEIAMALGGYGHTKDLTLQGGIQYVHHFDKLIFMPSVLTLGMEHNHNRLNDDSGYRKAGNINQQVETTSGILQNEWSNDRFGLLIGARYDHVKIDPGVQDVARSKPLNILTPRISFRYNPLQTLHFRLGYAQGFRAPQVFDEDLHVDNASGQTYERVLDPNLKEERSHSLTLSGDYYMRLDGGHQINLMAEGFWTKLLNKFNTSEADKNNIRTVHNADSDAHVYGANLEVRYTFRNLFLLNLGFTAQKSIFSQPEDTGAEGIAMREFMRTPDTYGYFLATWTPNHHVAWSLSGDYTGRMYVPHVASGSAPYIGVAEDIVARSPAFFTLGTKFSYMFHVENSELELNLGVNNIFNAYQKDFDEGPERDSAYIYGPKMPRTIFAGLKLTI